MALVPYVPTNDAPSDIESKSDYYWEVELSNTPIVRKISSNTSESISVDDAARLSCPLAHIRIEGHDEPNKRDLVGIFLEKIKECMAQETGHVSLDIRDPSSWLFGKITPAATQAEVHLTANVSSGSGAVDCVASAVRKMTTIFSLRIERSNGENLNADFVIMYDLYKELKSLQILRMEYAGYNFIRIARQFSNVQATSYQCIETLDFFRRMELDLRNRPDLTQQDIWEVGTVLGKNSTKFTIIQIVAETLQVFDLIVHSLQVAMKIICEVKQGPPVTIYSYGLQTSVNLNADGILKRVSKQVRLLLLHSPSSDLSKEDWDALHGLSNLERLSIFSYQIDEAEKLHITRRGINNYFGATFLKKLKPTKHFPKLQFLQIDRSEKYQEYYGKALEMGSLNTFIIDKVMGAEIGSSIIKYLEGCTAAAYWSFVHRGSRIIGTRN